MAPTCNGEAWFASLPCQIVMNLETDRQGGPNAYPDIAIWQGRGANSGEKTTVVLKRCGMELSAAARSNRTYQAAVENQNKTQNKIGENTTTDEEQTRGSTTEKSERSSASRRRPGLM